MTKVTITSATDGQLDQANPAKAKAPKKTASKNAKKSKAAPVVARRTSALADWMRENGINPKVGRAKLRRKGIARELTAEAKKALQS